MSTDKCEYDRCVRNKHEKNRERKTREKQMRSWHHAYTKHVKDFKTKREKLIKYFVLYRERMENKRSTKCSMFFLQCSSFCPFFRVDKRKLSLNKCGLKSYQKMEIKYICKWRVITSILMFWILSTVLNQKNLQKRFFSHFLEHIFVSQTKEKKRHKVEKCINNFRADRKLMPFSELT